MTASAHPQPQPEAPLPVQVIGYAGIGTDYVVPTGVKLLLGLLAGFHLLIGVPLVFWPIASAGTGVLYGRFFGSAEMVMLLVGFFAGAPNIACGLGMLLKRSRGTWKAIQMVLAVLCGLELLVFIGGGVLVISYKHATGWDTLAGLLGVMLLIASSVPFWLHAVSKLLLLRANVRRAFLFEHDEPVRLQRIGTVTTMSLYGTALLIGAVAYIVR